MDRKETRRSGAIDPATAKQKSVVSFQRAWVRVKLEDAVVKGHPSRLIIGSHGRNVEIGSCLNEEEKRVLVVQLRRAVQMI